MMYLIKKRFSLLPVLFWGMLFFVFSFNAKSATITATASGGNWNITTTWVGGIVPGVGDSVVIPINTTVTVISNTTCRSLTIMSNATPINATGTVALNTGVTLTLTGMVNAGGTKPNTGLNLPTVFSGGGTLVFTGSSYSSPAVVIGPSWNKFCPFVNVKFDPGAGKTLTSLCTGNITSFDTMIFHSGTFSMNDMIQNNGEKLQGWSPNSVLTIDAGAVLNTYGAPINGNNSDLNFHAINIYGTLNATGAGNNAGSIACDTLNIGVSGILNTSLLGGSGWYPTGTPPTTLNINSSGTVIYSGSSVQTVATGNWSYGNLTINNIFGVSLSGATTVNGILKLQSGALNLNSNIITVNNNLTNAITRISGYIVSETNAAVNPSIVQWNMGNTTGSFVFPFGVSGTQIPFSFNKTTAGVANVQVSTRATALTNNTPYAGASDGGAIAAVANMDITGTTDLSIPSVIDRWWDIYSSAPVTADLIFCYRGSENTTTSCLPEIFHAQHWNGTSWDSQVGSGAGVTSGVGTVSANGVSTFSPWVLSTSPPVLANVSSTSSVTCNGANNGNVTITPSGGAFPYTYSWSPSGGTGTNATVTGLSAQNYTVTVTDNSGCTATQTVAISQPTIITSSIGSQTTISCNGGNNGSATINVSGGTTPYIYSWSPIGGTNATATGLSANNYSVTITDNNGCTNTQTVAITEPTALTASMSIQANVSCHGGSNGAATISPNGGTSPYSYVWSDQNNQITASANGLDAETYTIVITDGNNCVSTQTLTITEPSILTSSINSTTNVFCNGGNDGSVTVTPAGGTSPYIYSWLPSGGTNSTANNLVAGTYTVHIHDAHNCANTETVSITQPTVLTSIISSSTSASCNGGTNGSATVNVSGGTSPYIYSWSPSGGTNATATGLSANNYTVTITDNNNCSSTQTVAITQPIILTSSVSSQLNISCHGSSNGSAAITVNGGTSPYTYSWSPSGGTNATATGLSANNYTIMINDANGCNSTSNVTLTEPSAVTLVKNITSTTCGQNNGSATITASGGISPYAYLWNNAATTSAISNLGAGGYCVTVTDNNGCPDTACVIVPNASGQTASINSSTNVSCHGGNNGSASVTVSAGTAPYTYSWSPSGGTNAVATGLSAGTYTISVTDATGCVDKPIVIINQPAGVALSVINQSNISCNGGSNGSATITASGGSSPYTYSWSPISDISATATGLSANTYTATVADANGCTSTQTVSITQPLVLSASVSSTNISCNGSSNGIATSVPGGGTSPYTYSWSPVGGTNATANNLGVGSYTVMVNDANGCSSSGNANITEPNAMTVTVIGTSGTCEQNNGSASAAVSGGISPYTYSWSNGGVTPVVNTIGAGTFTVIITDSNGCSQSQTVVVGTTPKPSIISSADTTIIFGGNATLMASGGVTYNWSPSTNLTCTNCPTPIATPTATTDYCVTVTDSTGCSDTSCVKVIVDFECGDVFVPNAFTPNVPGKNAMECVFSNCMQTMDFSIYDRWGEKVFESNDSNVCWDGTYKGEKLNTDVFVYYIKATLLNGKTVTKKGNISLFR